MLILLLLMAFALAAGCWAYSYVWRGLNRRVIAAVKVVDPMITLGPYIMAAWAAFMALIATNIWVTGTLHTVLTIIFWVIAVGCLGWAGFWLLMHCLGGQTPGKRPMWWREAVAAKFAWRNLSRMPAYLGARTSILPVENPHLTKPYSGSWTRPLGATMPGYSSNGEFIEGFDEFGRKMPHIYPVGPEPTILEMARWGKSVSSDQLLTTFLPTAPFERLRLPGTMTGPFTFAGEVPHGAVTKWPRRSGANRAFGSYARLGEITERKVELLVDHRIIVALQTTREKLRTPPQLDARLHRHRRRRLHDGRRRERQPAHYLRHGHRRLRDSVGLHQHPERQPASAPQGTPRHERTPCAQAEQRRADGLALRAEAQRVPAWPGHE